MTDTTNPQALDYARLASAVKARRKELRKTQQAIADMDGMPKISVYQLVEAGRPTRDGFAEDTLAGLDRKLGWAPGSAWNLLHGGTDPVLASKADEERPTLTELDKIIEDLPEPQRVAARRVSNEMSDRLNELINILGGKGKSGIRGPQGNRDR